jgi:multiple sugar transport system substrate-binding protein
MSLERSDRPLPVLCESALSRRRFLIASVSGVAAAAITSLISACGPQTGQAPSPTSAAQPAAATTPGAQQAAPGGFAGGGKLNLLMRSHFVPAFDVWFDKWADDWGTRNKVEIQHDHILAGELPAKIAAEVAAGSGHDIYGFTRPADINLYARQLIDVSDISKQLGDRHGGWIPLAEQVAFVEGTWKGVPDFFIDFPSLYRKDIFDDLGLKQIDTWDDLLKTGTILKDKGNPIGIAVNQKSNDSLNSWQALLWCYGASTVAQDGKTVAINSPQTKEALAFAIELYNKTMTNEVLSWDDTGNNLLLASGKGSWIHNPMSALRTIEKENPDLAKKIAVGNSPSGPKGRHAPVSTSTFGIVSTSSNQAAAKAFLTDFFQVHAEGVKVSEGYNQPMLKDYRKKPMPILGEDPRFNLLQDFDQVAHVAGYPGPPTAAAGEAEANWIVPLMVGLAVQNGDVNGAVDWAAQKLETIYAKR